MKLAHISDPHFGTEEMPVCDALRADLHRQAPDLVVLTGDVTQRARTSQFRAARAFLDSLGCLPLLAVPGNHDLPLFNLVSRFGAPYGGYRRYISPSLAPSWHSAEVAVVGLNSTRLWRHKHGEISASDVQAVAKQLRALPQAFKAVALHHPLAAIETVDRRNVARGAAAALDAWIGAGADLFLGGHIHLPYCIEVGFGTSHARLAMLLQAGTSLSRRRREGKPNSYHLVRLTGGSRCEIEQRAYDGRAFSPESITRAERTNEGWRLHTPEYPIDHG